MNKKIKLLNALGNETRINILQYLLNGELCACSIYPLTKKAQSTISNHLKVLEEAEIVESRRDGINIWYKIKSKEVIKILNILGFEKIKITNLNFNGGKYNE